MKLNLNKFFPALILPLLLATMFPVAVSAQSLTFSYAQTTLPLPSNLDPGAVAVDSAGNIYFSNPGQLLKVTPGGGLPVQIASFSASINSISVDAAGNVFFSSGSQVLKLPVGGGTPTPVGSGFLTPSGLAIDKQQNLYVADGGISNAIIKIASDGNGAQTTVPVAGVATPVGVALDAAGNIYVAANLGTLVELPVNGGAPIAINAVPYPVSDFRILSLAVDGPGNIYYSAEILPKPTPGSQLPNNYIFPILEVPVSSTPTGLPNLQEGMPGTSGQLAVDNQGNLYVVNAFGPSRFGITEALRTVPVNLGNVNVCGAGQTQPAPCSETAFLYYQVTSAGVFGGATVVTNGTTNDFQSGNNCSGKLSLGQTCDVSVTFTPSIPNAQSGTVQVVDGSGNVLATTAVKGSGVGTGSFLSGLPAGQTRNNYSGFVGFQFTVGAEPVEIFSLGRFVVPGNTGSHVVKLVQANGTDVPGGSATVNTGAGPSGGYAYAPLASPGPVTLSAGGSYYLVSQETAGGDQWYNLGPVTSTSDATIVGPTYTDASSHYVTVGGLPDNAYVPVNFQYSVAVATPISVSIVSPSSGSTVAGYQPITVTTTGLVTSLQAQIDGIKEGTVLGSGSTFDVDTQLVANGVHSLTVVAFDAQGDGVTSAPVSVTVSNQATGVASFVTGESLGTLRNNYSGFVGFAMAVGNNPLQVYNLGRYMVPGDSGTHLLKLVNADGTDVPGGSVSVSMPGQTTGGFVYANFKSGTYLTLQPNTTYFVVSQETAGGDQWYDFAPVMTTSVATVTAPVYTDGGGHYVQVSSYPGASYVPVSFLYQTTNNGPLIVTITSPTGGTTVSGNNVPVAVTITNSVTSLQLQVDGVNQGSPVSASPLTFNSTLVADGPHVLTVVATASGNVTAASPNDPVTVNNVGSAAFITGETPSTLRNNYNGFLGMQIKVGAAPITVTSLGRLFVASTFGTHMVKLVQANGVDLPGGSVTASVVGGTSGQFVYGNLASPVTLAAGTTYYLVSSESVNGDYWYDLEPVTGTGAAQILGATYTDGHGNYVTVPGLAGYSYVPVNFQYH